MNTLKPWPVPRGWQKPLSEWEKTLRARSLSPETIRTRLQHVRTTARGLECAPSKVTPEMLLEYVSKKPWQSETRHSYYASLKQFFAWYSRIYRYENPALVLPTVKRGSPMPRPIPDNLLAEALAGCTPRHRLALELAALAGLRSGEVARVNAGDITEDLLGYSLVVHGKGNKQRVVPITDGLAAAIRDLAEPGTGWVFPGADGGHVTPRWISKLGASLLPSPWTMHTLRHRFGTHAYAGDRDLVAVQRLLGHASVSTTQRYVEPPSDAMRRAANSAQIIH